MKASYRNFFAALILLLSALTGSSLAGGISIQSPSPAIPEFAVRGSSFAIVVKADKITTDFSAALSTGAFTIPVKITSKKFNENEKQWEITADVPETAPVELYDLKISSKSGADKMERAVKVIDHYKDTFTFIHISDVHVGDKIFEQHFQKVIEEINLLNPEFVLITGDSTTECENVGRMLMYNAGMKVSDTNGAPYKNKTDEENKKVCVNEHKIFLNLLSKLNAPSFVVPGNHDMAGIYNAPSRKIYEEMIGKRYYAFDYGKFHFTGIDNSQMMEATPLIYYDIKGYDDLEDEQLKWLEEDLKQAEAQKLRIAFFHVPVNKGNSKFKAMLKKYNVDMALAGHLHFNAVYSKTKPLWLQTTSTGDTQWDKNGYRLIRIKDGAIFSYTYAGDKKASIMSGKLNVKCSPENNGQNDEVKCAVKNELKESFDGALLKFIMPLKGNYEISGGTLQQEVKGEKYKILHVSTPLPEMQEISISAKKKN